MDQPIWLTFIVAFILMNVLLVGMAYMTLFERKVLAAMQDRVGPNRSGRFGLLQPLADAVKLLGKEDLIPKHADKIIFYFAPLVIFVTAIVRVAVIPFGNQIEIGGQPVALFAADLNVGALFLLAFGSLGVYGIILGAYASANRYSLLGGLRAAAQVVSYEIILGLSLVGVFLLSGSLSVRQIMLQQSAELQVGPLTMPNWFILSQPLAFVLFMIAAVAETNRAPFDMPEAESELISGFHTEYSGFRFSFYFLGEYINMIIVSLFAATLFLGGVDGPGADRYWGLGVLWLVLKVTVFLFFYIWLRGTLPRFRYDQLMGIAWKVLLPLVLLNIIVTAFIRLIGNGQIF
ncbi:MAG: NADH-quinone oxidoreductase subunit NuoH [Chloroflexia bacterium]|nr:NADH-quinone oxidoreductase subunit NuoH [Chloroflexia bacterium]MDQ3412017.1 NADH-quinone oxidoreductase subunit NuoH [Chloroflexota bacterium]